MENNILGLYDHNLESYKKVREAFLSGERIVGIIHATGTGKTLNALQLALDNKDKNILYLTPYNSIIEHIKEVIGENPNVDINRDFGHVKFMNYASLINMSKEELAELDVDMLILDEFHHIGAPVWGNRIDMLIETHPELLIFGMTAYSIRERGTAYERDLAEEGGDELFSDKIVSTFDLVDAMLQGILPVPNYKSAHIGLLELATKIENMAAKKITGNSQFDDFLKKLRDVKRLISSDDKALELLKDNVKPDGKYIYFCPVVFKNGVNDIQTIMNQTKNYFLSLGYKEEDLCFYTSSCYDADGGKTARKCFYNDVDSSGKNVNGKLRIMFAINQYNEGVHAPNVDGVILGRETKSDIVFFEQIGRALSVRGDTFEKIKEYQTFSEAEIVSLCEKKGITINDGMTKDDMIERLVAPVIIDLVGNYSFIRDLVTELKHRIRLYREIMPYNHRIVNITENSYIVDFVEQNLFETLVSIKEKFVKKTWEESYELAEKFYKKYNHLNINRDFKTDDGVNYDEFGYALGEWIFLQRSEAKRGLMSQEKVELLNNIGMVWSSRKTFKEVYELAKSFYIKNGHLRVPYNFKTDDGITYSEFGYNLSSWISNLRRKKKKNILSNNEIKLLEEIGMEWNVQKTWDESYEYAILYFKEFGNLDVPKGYLTIDGYNLYDWVRFQKDKYNRGELSEDKIILLEKLNIKWKIPTKKKNLTWMENYNLLKNYFVKYGNSDVKRSFVTLDGITFNDEGYNLGMWVSRQRTYYKEGRLSEDKINLLNEVRFKWNEDVVVKTWEEAYELAKNYYLCYGNLNIKTDFKTNDGVTFDDNGYGLGAWIYIQRNKYSKEELDIEKIRLLDSIGMIWNINKNYADIKKLFKDIGLNPRKYSSQVKALSYLEFEAKVNYLISNNLPVVNDKRVHEIFNISEANMVAQYGISREELIKNYSTLEKRYS